MDQKESENRTLREATDRRFRRWDADHGHAIPAHLRSGSEIDYITISREIGSGGEEIARRLAELMDWQVYDRNILNYMSENMNVHHSVLESVDERTRSWIRDRLKPFFTRKSADHIDQLSYYRHLGKVLLIIASHGRAIIVGRAAGHVLPRDRGLRVRITAPFKIRCQRYAQSEDITMEAAYDPVRKADKEQRLFLKSFVGKGVEAPEDYDLICNTEKLSPPAVAKLIWRTFDQHIADQHIADQQDQDKPPA